MARYEQSRTCVTLGVVLGFLVCAAAADEQSLNLEEVPAWTVPGFASGQAATCKPQPDPNVRAYPVLKSDKPVYGSVQFGSFEQERDLTLLYFFVADESAGPGTGYDRLYVDLNGDRDLRNDAPVAPKSDWPQQLSRRHVAVEKEVLFESIGIPLPYGAAGRRPVEMVARLHSLKGGGGMLSFVPLKARRGRIEIAGQPYDVFLGQEQPICGWFDHPGTSFYLVPKSGADGPGAPVASTTLMMMPCLGQTYYRFAATPAGDKLLVRPYEGPLGEFRVSPKWGTDALTVSGYLVSRDARIRVSGPQCRLPVGDYSLRSLTVTHDKLTFSVQPNVHVDGGFRAKLYHPPAYPIAIRSDTCFVLDFSHPPQMIFSSPPRNRRARPGENLFVVAVLTDPVLDFALCDLRYDSLPAAGPKESAAQAWARKWNATLRPQVTIARADGQIVAQGTMDYG